MANWAERAAVEILKEMAKERQRDFEEMLPRGSPGPARPPKARSPICGARTRAGHSCKARVVWLKGDTKPKRRCRLHGGANPKWSDSTRSVESRKRSAAALGLEYDELTERCHKPKRRPR